MEELVAVFNVEAVLADRIDANIEVLTEHGYLITNLHKLELTEKQANLLSSSSNINASAFLHGPVVAVKLRRENPFLAWDSVCEELDDTYASPDSYIALRDSYEFFPPSMSLERTLVIIKPGESKSRDEVYNCVMETLENNNFVVISKTAKILASDVARDIVGASEDEIALLSSDVSVCIVAEKMGAVDSFRLLLGHDDPTLARRRAPNTVRARLCSAVDRLHNGVIASPTAEKAAQDIRKIFPVEFPLERTLALVLPDVVAHVAEVQDIIVRHGFTIIATQQVNLSAERLELLLAQDRDSPIFADRVRYMSSGPVVAMVLCKPAAVDSWLKLIGPVESSTEHPHLLRSQFSSDSVRIAFYGSMTAEAARTEITQLFPQLPVEDIPKLPVVHEFFMKKSPPRPFADASKSFNDVLVEGLTQLCRVKPLGDEAVTWFAQWLLRNNPNKPQATTVELVEDSSTLSSISSSGKHISWVLGASGTRTSELLRHADSRKFEVVSCAELCKAAVAARTRLGETITECEKQKRVVPPNIISSLVKHAILQSSADNLIVTDFPNSLDQAFDFEQNMIIPARVVILDGSVAEIEDDAQESKEIASPFARQYSYIAHTPESVLEKEGAFLEDARAVADHYATFKKLVRISTNGDIAQASHSVAILPLSSCVAGH